MLAGSSDTSFEQAQLVWKSLFQRTGKAHLEKGKEKIEETAKKGLILSLLLHENIVGQPLIQLVCNNDNSSGKGRAHLENKNKNINR